MNFNEAKEIIKLNNEIFSEEEFINKNINFKIEKYCKEHILILKEFYDISKEAIDISRNSKINTFKEVYYCDIKDKINISEKVLIICFSDLQQDDFIIDIGEYKYAISPLGITLIEKLLEKNSMYT